MVGGGTTGESLDSTQYSTQSIRRYESVYGESFVSPGGREMALELIARLGLNPGARVLDVGCGLGGSAFVMARDFGFKVDGIDLSRNMLAIANAKLATSGLFHRVTLKFGDCLEIDEVDAYDGVYSRDTFLHIDDKMRLFEALKKSLRSGGTLLFTDYCCGDKPWSEEFASYVEARDYHLLTLSEYSALLEKAGFDQVKCEDLTERFIQILRSDLRKIDRLDIDESDRATLLENWRGKLARASTGDHRWGLLIAN